MEVVRSAHSAERCWKSERGCLRIRRPLPEVVVFIEEGYLDSAFVPIIAETSNKALRCSSRLHFFVDCYDLVSYAPEIRKGPTDWLLANRSRVEVQHMLVRSKITRMGLSVASLALGGLIKGYTSRSSFRLALNETLGGLGAGGAHARVS